jgi:hypothetical protein
LSGRDVVGARAAYQGIRVGRPPKRFDCNEGVVTRCASSCTGRKVDIHTTRRAEIACSVDPLATVKTVIAQATSQQIVAGLPIQCVIAIRSVEGIVARTSIQGVVHAAALQAVGRRGPRSGDTPSHFKLQRIVSH